MGEERVAAGVTSETRAGVEDVITVDEDVKTDTDDGACKGVPPASLGRERVDALERETAGVVVGAGPVIILKLELRFG